MILRSKTVFYLSVILALAFLLTVFNVTISLFDVIADFLQVYTRFPVTEFIFNFSYLFLLWFVLILYRRYKHEYAVRKKDEESLLSLQKAVSNMQIGVTITDAQGKIIYVNMADADIHGYTAEELIGQDVRIYSPPQQMRPMFEPMRKRFRRESFNIRKDGTVFPVYLMSDVVTNTQGDIIATITTCEDITERKKHEETIKTLAFYDTLTGLPNRSLFNDRLRQELAKARRHKQVMAVMFIDLDRFKVINDSLGHTTGDFLLQAVAQRIQNITREGDTVSRLGGDEFILLFPDVVSTNDARVIGDKILQKTSEVFVVDGKDLYITTSIGISMFPDNGDNIELLVKNADTAMYYAKEKGRNNYQFYTPNIDAYASEKLRLEANLRNALKRDELLLYFQPQVCIQDGDIIGAEVLLRWHRKDEGFISPGRFIPLAEETGLIQSIGEWVLRSSCIQSKRWQEAGYAPLRLSVNVSMYQLKQNAFAELVHNIINETNMNPQHIELELTESVFMQDINVTKSILHDLVSTGVHIAIDDFGTGYSSLSYLKYLPLSRLKLDQSFVHSLGINPNDEAITRAIIAMSQSLNLNVLAEGVETTDQLEFLRLHGCNEAQGFLFSKPLPADEFIEFIETYRQKKPFNVHEHKGRSIH